MKSTLAALALAFGLPFAGGDKSVPFNIKFKLHYQDWMSAETAKMLAEGYDRLGVHMNLWTGAEPKGDSLLLFVSIRDKGFVEEFTKLPTSEYRDDLAEKLRDQYGMVLAYGYKATMTEKMQAIKKQFPKITGEDLMVKIKADPFFKPLYEDKLCLGFRICEPNGTILKAYDSPVSKKDGGEDETGDGDEDQSQDPG